jgi:peptidyl-prolyl cis-trans isomerase C
MSFSQRILLPALAAAALGLSPVSQAADSNVLASVNGKPITQQDYDTYVRENLKGHSQAADKQQVVNELISRELVYQDAMKQGLDKDPEVQKKLEELKQKLILGAALEKAMSDKPVSDAELKKLYNQKVADFNVKEFKARHILLKNKSDAEKVITELDMGADFADLAKKKSTGPSSKKGGDLGWFAPQQMVPAFSSAVSKMKKGEYTKQPVKTQFGWHVIKLEDTRQAEPPSFDSVKPRLQKVVQQRRVGEYIRSLKSEADIKVNQ